MGGCVGHYLFDELAKRNDLDLIFLIRSPEKVKYSLKNITVIKDDLKNINKYAGIIKGSDYVVHLLADWGTEAGNYGQTKDLAGCLDPEKLEKMIYFSTASILGNNNKADEKVLSCGTPYIRGKYKMHREFLTCQLKDKLITLYPTWVLGGDSKHPYSHASTAIKGAMKWLWLLRFFSVDIKFHFIHAKDIAAVTAHLLNSSVTKGDYVLGNAAITADEIIDKACAYFKMREYFKVPVTEGFVRRTAKIIRKELTPWDDHCLKNRRQVYSCVNPATFGIRSELDTIEKIFGELFEQKL